MNASSAFRLLGFLFLGFCLPKLSAGSLASTLTASEREQISKGTQIIQIEEVEGCPWPQVTIFQKVQAKPDEVAAVFFDFEDSKRFIPNVLNSKISRTISPAVLEVDYAINVPILPDEYYTVRNTLSQPNPNCYDISWKLLKAVQTKDSVGSFQTESWEDETLIRYRNLVTPGSRMAGLLRSIAIGQMEGAASAIVERAETLKKSNPKELKTKVQKMRAALGE